MDFYSKANRATAVIADMLYDTYQMTEYLYSIGHRRIGFVGSIHATVSYTHLDVYKRQGPAYPIKWWTCRRLLKL